MPVIKTYSPGDGQLDTGGRSVPRIDLDGAQAAAVGRQGAAIQRFGAELGQVATQFAKRQEEQEKFTAGVEDDARRQELTATLQDMSRSMPETGQGFHDQFLAKADEVANNRFAKMPAHLQDRYRQAWNAERLGWSRKAAELQTQQSDKFAVTKIGELQNGLVQEINANPDPAVADAVFQRGVERIREAPIPETAKAELSRNWETTARTAELQARFRSDPQGMARALGVQAPSVAGATGVEQALIQRESSGNPRSVNQLGYAGLFQFGAPRLETLGLYRPGEKENLQGWSESGRNTEGKWSGTFAIPGFPEVRTLQDFLANPTAQRAAYEVHRKRMDQEITERGMERFIGQTVGGVEITREGLHAMMHLGGAGGAAKALESDGKINPKDANGTSVLSYAALAKGAPVSQPDPRYANVAFDQRQRLVASAETQRHKEEAVRANDLHQQYTGKLNSLLVAIQDGNATLVDVQKARSDGWLTDAGDIGKATKAIESRDKAVADIQGFYQAISTPGFTWNTFDKSHKDMAEAGFSAMGGSMPALQTVVEKTGIVPAPAATALRGAIVSGAPQRVEGALQVASNLMARNPNIFSGVQGAKEIEDAAVSFRHYVNDLGFTATEAAHRIVRDNSPEYQAGVKARIKNEDVDAIIKKQIDPVDLRKAFNEGWTFLGRPEVEFTPGARQSAMSDYAELFKDYYLQSGDVSKAKANAVAQMKKVWGVTNVSGTGVLVKYPPEKAPAYAGIENAADLIAKQATEAIKAEAGADAPRSKIILVPTDGGQTARAFKSGEAPPYYLSWSDKNGVVHMLNPGRAFVADPDRMRGAITAQRQAGFEERRAEADRGFDRRDAYSATRRRLQEEARERIVETRREVEGQAAWVDPPGREAPASVVRDETGKPSEIRVRGRRMRVVRDDRGRFSGIEQID